ncbi:MAG: alpha/beta hydrolase, partial [Planctomycetaceae bacterium]
RQPHQPNFGLLLYPWNLTADGREGLLDGLSPSAQTPPCFLVHTDDDRSSALGSALFYVALKNRGIPSELHVYGRGGHGYGLRPVAGSDVGDWPSHAATWLQAEGWTRAKTN